MSKRRIVALVAGVTLVLVAATLIFSNVSSHKGAKKTLDTFKETVVPAETSISLVAPATDDWWQFTKAMGEADNGLYELDLPKGATWVGYSEGRAKRKDARESQMLTVFYAGFESPRAAKDWLDDSGLTTVWGRATGSVVEFVPFYTSFSDEDFPTKAPEVVEAPKVAVWSINFTDHFKHLEAISKWKHTDEFFKNTGLRGSDEKPVVWTGTSSDPRGRFKGKIENASEPDTWKMWSASVGSAKIVCDSDTDCEEKVPGLNALMNNSVFMMYEADGEKSYGDRRADASESVLAREKGAWGGFFNWSAAAYIVAHGDAVPNTDPVGFDFKVKGDNMEVAAAWLADDE